MDSKKKAGTSRIIQYADLLLPSNFKMKSVGKVWDYTCRVCDDDVFDGCHDVVMSDFASDFAGV